MSLETLPRSDEGMKAVNNAFRRIVEENFGPITDSTTDAEFANIIEANYGPYVAEPLILEGVGVFFPYDWSPERLTRCQELFRDFNPIHLPEYPDLESFLADERPQGDSVGTINFMGFFQNPMTIAGLHRSKPVFSRFEILYPEMVTELDNEIAYANSQGITGIGELKEPVQEKLLRAYNYMVHLVGGGDDDSLFRFIEATSDGSTYEVDDKYLQH